MLIHLTSTVISNQNYLTNSQPQMLWELYISWLTWIFNNCMMSIPCKPMTLCHQPQDAISLAIQLNLHGSHYHPHLLPTTSRMSTNQCLLMGTISDISIKTFLLLELKNNTHCVTVPWESTHNDHVQHLAVACHQFHLSAEQL